jgi:hypothetical protein
MPEPAAEPAPAPAPEPAPAPAPLAPAPAPRLDAEFWTHFMRESRATREAARRERIHSLLRF